MSDSSSEDEIPKELLDSIDKNLMNNSLFANDEPVKECRESKAVETKLPSLRYVRNEDDRFTRTSLTKSKQEFIAKRLSEMLDSQLEESNFKKKHKNKFLNREKMSESGVTLFSDSHEYVDVDCVSDDIICRRKKPKLVSDKVNRIEIDNRCKATAVSPDWILSGTCVKGWSRNSKGEVIRVKRKNKSNSSNVIECEIIK